MKLRPVKCELPYEIRECGQLEFTFMLDFASYRDLQRQRAVITRMPLLTTGHGFEEWYLENLAPSWQKKAFQLLDEYQDMVQSVDDKYIRQYYIPMGYRTPIRTTGDLRALTYLVELRTGKTVHPTLRIRSIEMGKLLGDRFSEYGLKLYLDTSPDDFDIRRGLHDIVEKN